MNVKIKVDESTWKNFVLREDFNVSKLKMNVNGKYIGIVGYKVDPEDVGVLGNVYIKHSDGWYKIVNSWGKLADLKGTKLRYLDGMTLANLA